jgi:acyl dehydratase
MSLAVRQFSAAAIGQWVQGSAIVIDADRAALFADSIVSRPDSSDVDSAHAIPMINVLPIYSCLFAAVDLVTPGDLRATIVHGAHDLRFLAPVRTGATLRARARVTGIHSTRAGAGISVQIEVADETGATTSLQWATALVRGAAPEDEMGTRCPVVDLEPVPASGEAGSPVAGVSAVLRADQPQRFSDASGDLNAVHLDDEVARQAGFEGVILHGLCTLGIAGGGAIATCCDRQPGRLRRLAGRFAAPAYPTGELTTSFQPLGGGRYGFETLTSDGVAVIRHGLVAVG